MQSSGALNGPLTAREMLNAEADMVGQAAALGNVVSVDPETAAYMAAFADDALDGEAAEASRFDDQAAEGTR